MGKNSTQLTREMVYDGQNELLLALELKEIVPQGEGDNQAPLKLAANEQELDFT